MQAQKGAIKYYIIIIVFILGFVFLSQQAFTRGYGQNIISAVSNQAGAYLAKSSDWASKNILQKVTGEVQKRGDTITSAIDQGKQKVTEDVGKKIQDYFSGVEKSIVSPGTPQNCPPTPPAK